MDTEKKPGKRNKKPYIISSWDDGRISDLRLIPYLQYYNIPSIFYLTSTYELSDDHVRFLADNFEVGGHSSKHFELSRISIDGARQEIENNKSFLEGITGKKINSFCYPRGRYNEDVKKLVKEAGYTNARTTGVMNISRYPADYYEIVTSIHISYPYRKEYYGKDVVKLSKELFDNCRRIGGLFHIWGHSWELDKHNTWKQLEEVLKYITRGEFHEGSYTECNKS